MQHTRISSLFTDRNCVGFDVKYWTNRALELYKHPFTVRTCAAPCKGTTDGGGGWACGVLDERVPVSPRAIFSVGFYFNEFYGSNRSFFRTNPGRVIPFCFVYLVFIKGNFKFVVNTRTLFLITITRSGGSESLLSVRRGNDFSIIIILFSMTFSFLLA